MSDQKGLQRNYIERTIGAREKAIKAINILKAEGQKVNFSSISREIKQKTGKTYDAIITPDYSGEYAEFKFELPTAEDLSVGKCPKCGADVVERDKLFGCTNQECRFAIWKEDKFFAGISKKLSPAIVKSMLANKRVGLKNCISKKSGKKFDCIVYVDFSEQYPKYEMRFADKK